MIKHLATLATLLASVQVFAVPVSGPSEVSLVATKDVAEMDLPFPTDMECVPQAVYRHRPDGQPGREIKIKFVGGKLYGPAEVDIAVAGIAIETVHLAVPKEITEQSILLPPGVAVDREAQVSITVRSGKHAIRNTIMVPSQRQWTVYLLPHSHVDIGYTNTHENVEFIHKRNIMEAIKLAKETAHYPPEARFRWDTEVSWPAERLLTTGTEEEKKAMLDAIRAGIINIGASYINDNTSVSADEEFAALFAPSEQIGKLTGIKFDTLMQVDIPGMSWGVIPAAAMHGIPYVLIFNNGSDRTGHSMEISHRPFWWIGPDGTSKVLCIQPGSYVPGAQLKGHFYWPAMMGQTDRSKLPAVIKSDNPRANFIDGYLWKTLASLEKDPLYPYDIFPMSWAMADNMPIDADLPHAVKSWNEDYAYPKIVIASSHDIMAAFDKQYGRKIPTRTGEFTEYWSDGLGSAAKQTSMNRNAKERLIQADTLWSMLRPGQPAPRADFDEAWRNVLMGSEHTWCYSDPKRQPLTHDILKVKFDYFQSAHDRSEALLAEALKPTAAPQSKTISVFNTLSWPRTGLVTLPKDITSLKGISTQTLSTGETVFLAKDVPALGVRSYTIGPIGPIERIGPISPTTLDNGIVKVTLDPTTGDIISLVRDGKEFVDQAAPVRLNTYRYVLGHGKPAPAGPQYATRAIDGKPDALPSVTLGTGPSEVKISIKENGPVLASLLVESQAEGCKWLRREVRLLAGQPQIEIINTLDKTATTTKEGVHFGFAFDIPQPRTRMDIPWGVAEVDADFFPEANRNWICFQRWLDISNAERGVTWTSLDAPTFQSGAITANIIGAAINSPAWIRKLQPSGTIYSWALNNHWHTNFPLSQEGVLTFRYGILPHNTGYNAAAANRFGIEQARPLICTPTQGARSITPPVTIDNPSVVISSVKSESTDLIVTLRSLSDRQETVSVTTAGGAQKSLTLPPNGVRVDRIAR
ncbi:MAG: glycoside hydrolase family 38 C-terminal domain-containing protein [Verrucomicrobiota bacterium]